MMCDTFNIVFKSKDKHKMEQLGEAFREFRENSYSIAEELRMVDTGSAPILNDTMRELCQYVNMHNRNWEQSKDTSVPLIPHAIPVLFIPYVIKRIFGDKFSFDEIFSQCKMESTGFYLDTQPTVVEENGVYELWCSSYGTFMFVDSVLHNMNVLATLLGDDVEFKYVYTIMGAFDKVVKTNDINRDTFKFIKKYVVFLEDVHYPINFLSSPQEASRLPHIDLFGHKGLIELCKKPDLTMNELNQFFDDHVDEFSYINPRMREVVYEN